MLDFAPIGLFVYRRVDHLGRVLDALAACPEFLRSPVFVFSDGPKSEAAAEDVETVRQFVGTRMTPNMALIEAPENRGLAASITGGVARLCNEFGRAIVIEDDLVVAPCALTWFNAALDRYRNEPAVWQVSGFQYRVPEFSARDQGVFLHLTTSWGWATWKRAWDKYDAKATGWERLRTDPALSWRFDMRGNYPYTQMMLNQAEGRSDSWAIRWWWTVFREGGIALFPPRSLVRNIGHDATATHTRYRFIKRYIPRRLLSRLFSAFSRRAPSGELSCPQVPPATTVREVDDIAVSSAMGRTQRLAYRIRQLLFE